MADDQVATADIPPPSPAAAMGLSRGGAVPGFAVPVLPDVDRGSLALPHQPTSQGGQPAPDMSQLGGATSQASTPPIRGFNPSTPDAALAFIHHFEDPKGQNGPNYRYDAGHTASGWYQITDTNWRSYGPKAGINIEQYPTAMSAPVELQTQVARKMYEEQGFGPWAPYNPNLASALGLKSWVTSGSPALQERMDANMAEARRLQDQYHGDSAELMRRANMAPTGSKERDDAIAELRVIERDYRNKYEAVASHPPVMKPVDALENFGSAATIISLIGGLFARRHLTAALGAAGQAMQAINQNNWDKFQQEYKTWDQQSTTALNMVKLHNEEIRALIDDKKMAEDEKNSRLKIMFEALGMNRQADQMALGVSEKVLSEMAGIERLTMTASQNKLAFQQSVAAQLEAKYISEGMAPEEARAKAGRESGIIPGGGVLTPAKAQEQEVQTEIKRLNDIWDKDHPDAARPEKAEAHHKNQMAARTEMAMATAKSGTGTISDEQANLLADQYIQGNYAVITALPRSGSSRIKVENLVAEKMRGLPDAARTISMNRLRMVEAESAARTAGRVTMNTEMFSIEAQKAGEELKRVAKVYAEATGSTSYPKVNEAIRAYELNTGDPHIIELGVALNALRNAYGKMSNPTGTGIHDADKEQFAKILDTRLALGQIDGGVNQIITEGRIMSDAAMEAQERVLGRIAPRAPGQAAPASTASPSASSPSATGAGKPIIQNGWRYDPVTYAPLGPAR